MIENPLKEVNVINDVVKELTHSNHNTSYNANILSQRDQPNGECGDRNYDTI